MWRVGEEVSVALGRCEGGAPGGERWRRHWAWGEVVFTGRRGGDVDGGGSLGRVGKDCVTGLLLSSDDWGKWKQGEAIFLLRRGQRRIQFGPEGG